MDTDYSSSIAEEPLSLSILSNFAEIFFSKNICYWRKLWKRILIFIYFDKCLDVNKNCDKKRPVYDTFFFLLSPYSV